MAMTLVSLREKKRTRTRQWVRNSLTRSTQALEPYISTEIMKLHHQKHHQAYVNGFNQAEEKLQNSFQAGNVTELIALQNQIKFNGGGRHQTLLVE